MRDLAASLVHADQGTGGRTGRLAPREKRTKSRAYEVWRRARPTRPRYPALGRGAGRLRAGVAGSACGPAAHRHDPNGCTLSAAYGDGEPHAHASRTRHSRPRGADVETATRAR